MREDQPLDSQPFSSTPPDSSLSVPESLAHSSATSSSDPIPWYLQVDTPNPPASSHPLADRQLIPDLPEKSPSILSPMLSYLSVKSGLDNLTILDLRSLDPPPALGANLLMIIGTARSVKHLNVSADRFCRWLRSNHKLRPFADGLLGRNELKLKLRRKARRAKLAASVGNTMYEKGGGADDGITTGWICVNVGQVEDGIVEDAREQGEVTPESVKEQGVEAVAEGGSKEGGFSDMVEGAAMEEEEEYENPETSSEDQDDAYIGFGSRPTAPRIVVQMFTEEKRAELDLEGLWQDRSTRRTRKANIANDDAEAAIEEEELIESDFSSSIPGRPSAQQERVLASS
jgi:Ribosomal silencing factor during starvation